MDACVLCGADRLGRFGELRHEGCCPHFMRGPDDGGDPHEWPTIMDAIAEVDAYGGPIAVCDVEEDPANVNMVTATVVQDERAVDGKLGAGARVWVAAAQVRSVEETDARRLHDAKTGELTPVTLGMARNAWDV